MSSLDRWVRRSLRRLEWGRFLGVAAGWLACYCCLFGGLVLIAKLAVPAWWPQVLWLSLGPIPVLLVGYVLTRSQRFTHQQAVSLLDHRMEAGGLLMMLSETRDPVWMHHLPQVDSVWKAGMPRLRPTRFFKVIALPVAFALGSCLVPLKAEPSRRILHNPVSARATDEINAMLELLDEEEIVDEEEKSELLGELVKLTAETSNAPLTQQQWETLDAIRERLNLRLDTAALTNQRALEAAMALAGVSSEDLAPEQMAQLESAIEVALQRVGSGELPNLPTQTLQHAIGQVMRDGQLRLPQDPQTRQQMMGELTQFLQLEGGRLGELQLMYTQDGADPRQRSRFMFNSLTGGLANEPRGTEATKLTFGSESKANRAKFKSVILPPGFLDQPKTEIEQVVKSAPVAEPAATAPRSLQRELDPASGRATWNRRVSPRHREVLRGYFTPDGTAD